MSLSLNKLRPEDIDEKIRLNQRDGIDIYRLRDLINDELKDFIWTRIRAEVQCQFFVEQLEHIDKRIKELEVTNGIR